MNFTPAQYTRRGEFNIRASLEEVFPLLCPKREEEWIPGWECETLWSQSGYNEEGAIFRTTKPYGTELYWNTLEYDLQKKVVDFLISAPHRFMFRFRIDVKATEEGFLTIFFSQTFTSVSEEGEGLLNQYRTEDFAGRLGSLGELMSQFLSR
jgi:hypothetical protein